MERSSCSKVQQEAEIEILNSLSISLGIDHGVIRKETIKGVKLDGYAVIDGTPYCIEIWAHQGKAKGAQKYKIMNDACKLVLVEKLIGKECNKIICVSDELSISFLQGVGWQGRFIREHGIKTEVVNISEETKCLIVDAQKRQYR